MVCLKLKDLINKVGPKHINEAAQYTCSSGTYYSSLRQNYCQNHALSRQEDYDPKLPAEPPTSPDLISEYRYPHLRALRTDVEIGDGLWLCCHCHCHQHPHPPHWHLPLQTPDVRPLFLAPLSLLPDQQNPLSAAVGCGARPQP
ncbi:uncharacterized protein M421DRAFT_91501 [Didymella exigua CBS 183.55]|uniref:Uncharacterized protein n=1 Tax=Didymella exigua CBS 183.55 TaxID=1150837 RepID=A0A6A5RRJ2_9PLEO|nr:uncharacterized protein M421DRAFT_91501 [Didymella exigua CBS 183.55]KAF1929674.1 hypothetical protein M421DRAFT_91501 [Didymella exigua CBS 183.55]